PGPAAGYGPRSAATRRGAPAPPGTATSAGPARTRRPARPRPRRGHWSRRPAGRAAGRSSPGPRSSRSEPSVGPRAVDEDGRGRAHLDHAPLGARALLGPADGRVQVGYLEHEDPGESLLRLGEGAV